MSDRRDTQFTLKDLAILVAILAVIGVMILFVRAELRGMSKDADERETNRLSGHHSSTPADPTPEPAPALPTVDVSNVKQGERDVARDVARQILSYCGGRNEVWSGVQSLVVEHHDIFSSGDTIMIWEVQAKFPERWKFEVLRGNVLWYRLDENRRKIFAMKTVSGTACDVTAERWVSM